MIAIIFGSDWTVQATINLGGMNTIETLKINEGDYL